MESVTELFRSLLQNVPHADRGDRVILNCPACGDTRKRGGFLWTQSPDGLQGFRYHCFNAGCEFERATGWEPGSKIGFRVRHLYELLGGNPVDLIKAQPIVTDHSHKKQQIFVPTAFPEMTLPSHFVPLIDVYEDPKYEPHIQYLMDRYPVFIDYLHRFWVSDKMLDRIILDYRYDGKITGWLGRKIVGNDGARFLTRKVKNFFPGMDLLKLSPKYVMVMESPFDALLLRGVASMGSSIPPVLEQALANSSRIPILLPDRAKGIEAYMKVAQNRKWPIWVPPKGYKDVGDYLRDRGLLNTIMEIVDAVEAGKATHIHAKMELRIHGL
ncbi:MAG: hypothetical protein D6698_07630 [Gammaproteobacteria bacterium]|nr:MAG: hypothetical protein D6698_07630 [Gammaproteobacteria bacterium]